MNDVLKQRLVGALILLALAVVFWPIIFVDQKEVVATTMRPIPPAPQVDTRPLTPPDQSSLRSSAPLPDREAQRLAAAEQAVDVAPVITNTAPPSPAVQTEQSSAENKPVAAKPETTEPERLREQPPEKPALDADGVPIAWMLQVASVSSADKADQLRQQLLGMGHQAYQKKVSNNGRTLWRVYIGPKFEKAKLEKIRPQVDKVLGVKTLVMRYYP